MYTDEMQKKKPRGRSGDTDVEAEAERKKWKNHDLQSGGKMFIENRSREICLSGYQIEMADNVIVYW